MDDFRTRAGTLIGDYRLDQFLGESPLTVTWLAEQASIRRPVVVIELKPTALDARESFLATVRAQAAVDHPLVGSVYEAVSQPDHCFVALERLPGTTLADRLSAREPMKPGQVAHVLRRISEASLALEAAGTSTSPMDAGDVFVDSHGVVRLANLATSGEREPGRSAADIATLGHQLPALVADGRPGASRTLTLLAWMRGENLERTLSWNEVRSYAEQIEQQLTEAPAAAAPQTARAVPRKSPLPLVLAGIAVAALSGIAFLALRGNSGGEPPPPLPEAIAIPAGDHPTPDAGIATLPSYSLAAHEVTIGEYEAFLKALTSLPLESRSAYDHTSQPAEKSGHEPDDWAEILAAAKSGGQWQGRTITRDCPVVNVDWWDAVAYCDWKGGRLPTEVEWFAALRHQLPDVASLKPSGWGPVTQIAPTDRTPAGFLGMAGSVAEWTSSQSLNPANPLGEKKWVIIGASFLKPAGGAAAREWTDSRDQRRPDLGFRIAQ